MAFESLAQEEFKRALYTEAETPNKTNLAFIYIDADINGKRVFTRTIFTEKVKAHQPHSTCCTRDRHSILFNELLTTQTFYSSGVA